MKAIGYIRVSTLAQAGEDRYGIGEQRKVIEQYAMDNGYDVVQWLVDGGVSGVKEERPEFDKLLYGDASEGIDAVLIAKSDRLARDIKLYYYFLMLLDKKGIELISCTEPIVNDDSGLGNVYRSLMLFVAEQERKNIMMRTMAGRRGKARNGGWAGGTIPYGYTSENKKLVVNPDEAKAVRMIFYLREDGKSLPQIVTYLTDHGMKTRKGTYFSIAHINRILHGELFYRGYYSWAGSTPVKGDYMPILMDDIEYLTQKEKESE